METIIPHVLCLVKEEEYEEFAKSPFYPEIYVENKDLTFSRHLKLSGNRHVKVPVTYKDLPDPIIKALSKRIENAELAEVNFLPDGKVPFFLLSRIVAFFRAVMALRKSEVEAHAWIVWNKEKGYHIVIPEQNVSKASVHFEYKDVNNYGDIVVVDIHSHNTMSAFYSGTDNNSDEKSVNYSMVVGQLKPETYTYVIRFNLYKTKVAAQLKDVFDDVTEDSFEVPKEWLEKIKVPEIKQYSTQYLGYPKGIPNESRNKGKGKGKHTSQRGVESETGFGKIFQYGARPSWLEDSDGEEFWRNVFNYGLLPNEEIDPNTGEITSKANERNTEFIDSKYLEHFSPASSEALTQIELYLNDILMDDSALVEAIRTAYNLLGEKGRADIATNGF